MRTANQLTFTTYEASLRLKPNDPIKVICRLRRPGLLSIHKLRRSILVHLRGQRATTLFPYLRLSFLPACGRQVYLGDVSSDRKLASALRYNARALSPQWLQYP